MQLSIFNTKINLNLFVHKVNQGRIDLTKFEADAAKSLQNCFYEKGCWKKKNKLSMWLIQTLEVHCFKENTSIYHDDLNFQIQSKNNRDALRNLLSNFEILVFY